MSDTEMACCYELLENVWGRYDYGKTLVKNLETLLTEYLQMDCKLDELQTGKQNDTVNHPSHYTFGDIEVIDAIEDWKLDYHLGNAVKYIARANHKGNKKQDLQKAVWYIERVLDNTGDEQCP